MDHPALPFGIELQAFAAFIQRPVLQLYSAEIGYIQCPIRLNKIALYSCFRRKFHFVTALIHPVAPTGFGIRESICFGNIRLDIQNCRAVQKITCADQQPLVSYFQKLHGTYTDRVGPVGRTGGNNAVMLFFSRNRHPYLRMP